MDLSPNKSKFRSAAQERIEEDFCPDCKHGKTPSSCPRFIYDDAVCISFEFKDEEAREAYEQLVLHRQAVSLWLDKGKDLFEIEEFPEEKLLSILPRNARKQFKEAEAHRKELLRKHKEEHPDGK